MLVSQGKSWTTYSKHISGLAADLLILDSAGKPVWDVKQYKPLGEFWQRLGGIWGGSWEQIDAVHFEYNG